MFKNVLVPTDGSPLSEHALPWALAAAGERGGVHLVHVHEYLTPMAVEGMVMAAPADDLARREVETIALDEMAARVRAVDPGRTVTARNVESDGRRSDGFASAVATTKADLVVVATHGRGPLGRFFFGSASDELLRHSPVPVLLVRPADDDAPADLSARPRLEHLVVGLDGSALAERIIEPALALGGVFGVDFTLVLDLAALTDRDAVERIARPNPLRDTPDSTPARRAGRYLGRIARVIADRMRSVQTRLVREGEPADVLLRTAGDDPATAVALATHGRSGVSRLLRGSVADEVVRHAAGPVLAFHPPG